VPGLLDAILVALIVIGAPIDGAFERRRLERAIASGDPNARLDAYRRVIRWGWIAAAVLLAFWLLAQRPADRLGLGLTVDVRFGIAAGIAITVIGLMAAQARAAARPAVAEQVRAAAESVLYLLPATQAELRGFTWVGITAGIVEELIFRGYLMWVVASFAPMWVALLATSIAFGVGHLYQGAAGIAKTGAVGLALGGLYWLSGSIWVPMFVHAMFDVLQGRMVHTALRHDTSPSVT
jgi:uncharacterized protein